MENDDLAINKCKMVFSTDENLRTIADIKAHLSSLSSADHVESKDESSEQLFKPEAVLLRQPEAMLLRQPEAMLLRQRLQTLCRSVLLNNLEAALDRKLETDLWNFAFKAQITALQQLIKSKPSNAKKTELQADFHLFLESSLGFYMQLLEDICETFHLHPHFRRKYSSFGIIQGRREQSRRSQARLPSQTSSMYICQYCLVHLGDIARYLQRISLAENFYNLAARYVPSNGQPYNQLAILCSSRSNKLAVTYYYIRSIAVRSPFPVAPTNLEKLYSKQIKDCESTNFVSKNKWTHGEVVTAFLYLQALVHLEADKEKTSKLAELLYRCLCSQTIFSLLTPQNMTYMVSICLFTLYHIDNTGSEQSLTDDESHFRDVTVGFLAGFLEVLLIQAQKYNVREHMALPTINIILKWFIRREGYLSNSIVKTHRCWLNLAKTLNAIQSHCKDPKTLDLSMYDHMPLAEDVELQCFLPLQKSHDTLDFDLTRTLELDPEDATRLRCKRLVDLGRSLSEKYPSLNLIDYKVNAKNTKIIFSASTAITVERRRRPNNRNVAIQALKSQETSASAAVSIAETTQEDLSMWTPGGPLGLTPASDPTYPSGFDKVSSYSSFQSDVTAGDLVRTASPAPVSLYGLLCGSHATTTEDFRCPSPGIQLGVADYGAPLAATSQGASLGVSSQEVSLGTTVQGAPLGVTMQNEVLIGATSQLGSQGAIGAQLSSKSRTLAELIDATRIADPVLQPSMNFSASDSSVLLSHGSSYSLFSPTFAPAAVPDALTGDDLQSTPYLPNSSSSYSAGWPTSVNQHNISGLEMNTPTSNNWGNKSALAQLLEEQQKRSGNS